MTAVTMTESVLGWSRALILCISAPQHQAPALQTPMLTTRLNFNQNQNQHIYVLLNQIKLSNSYDLRSKKEKHFIMMSMVDLDCISALCVASVVRDTPFLRAGAT